MPTVTRLLPLVALAVILTVTLPSGPVRGGGLPDTVPPEDWVTVKASGSDILQFLQTLPHDPNPLGVRSAHLRTRSYRTPFYGTRFASLDGTPLAGRIAAPLASAPRPGVVLVAGITQTKDLKFMVELAELFARNGWHVLTLDLRGHGESRGLSPALITGGWREADDILGAARHLRRESGATSVGVIGFSMGGKSLVKAMAKDDERVIAAGVAVTAPLAPSPPLAPPEPGYTPGRTERFFLEFLGASSFHEYYERAARSYGLDLRTLESRMPADAEVARVRAPLLMLYTLDDFLWHGHLRAGRHDGGTFSLAYRDAVKNHPHVKTLLLDRGNHAGMLYLSDPHWFGVGMLSYLKHWQARGLDHVTVSVPPLDVLAEGTLAGETVTYRFVVRNHGPKAIGPLDVRLDVPPGARLGHCWLGSEGLGRCTQDGARLSWALPRLSGGKTTAGPFVAVLDVSSLRRGPFEASVGVEPGVVVPQEVSLEKP
jgi:pimeloyl-ACP methyl ester carboxylesterase